MKIVLLATGKTEAGFWADALTEYTRRLQFYVPFETVTVHPKNNGNPTEIQQRDHEGQLLLEAILPSDYVVVLDECGKQMTSAKFAKFVEKSLLLPQKRIVFVTGGAFGFSGDVYHRSDEMIGMSRMTFSHQMIRPIFAEQLYRAMTIIKGEKYHHA